MTRSLGRSLVPRETAAGTVIPVKVLPRSSKDVVVGVENGELKVKVRSPPVDGAANEALLDFLSKSWGLAASRLRVVRGQTSRHKTVEVKGLTAEQLYRLLDLNGDKT